MKFNFHVCMGTLVDTYNIGQTVRAILAVYFSEFKIIISEFKIIKVFIVRMCVCCILLLY